jgi:hypothetical protein
VYEPIFAVPCLWIDYCVGGVLHQPVTEFAGEPKTVGSVGTGSFDVGGIDFADSTQWRELVSEDGDSRE